MAKIDKFEDILAWKEARKLNNNIFEIAKKLEKQKEYSLSDQIKRASISIMANIAEGFSRKTKKDFSHFLFIAKASATEVQSLSYILLDQKYIIDSEFKIIYEKSDYVQRLLSNFIKYLNSNDNSSKTK
jgi:four helix bundle protein